MIRSKHVWQANSVLTCVVKLMLLVILFVGSDVFDPKQWGVWRDLTLTIRIKLMLCYWDHQRALGKQWRQATGLELNLHKLTKRTHDTSTSLIVCFNRMPHSWSPSFPASNQTCFQDSTRNFWTIKPTEQFFRYWLNAANLVSLAPHFPAHIDTVSLNKSDSQCSHQAQCRIQ